MAIVERHTSPDGLLTLLVDRAEDGDWSVGFDRSAWHTHGDILMLEFGGTPASAVKAFVDEIVNSRRPIGVARLDGEFHEAWVADNSSEDETRYAEKNVTIEKRFWNGRSVV
jgi:hypothetical protein